MQHQNPLRRRFYPLVSIRDLEAASKTLDAGQAGDTAIEINTILEAYKKVLDNISTTNNQASPATLSEKIKSLNEQLDTLCGVEKKLAELTQTRVKSLQHYASERGGAGHSSDSEDGDPLEVDEITPKIYSTINKLTARIYEIKAPLVGDLIKHIHQAFLNDAADEKQREALTLHVYGGKMTTAHLAAFMGDATLLDRATEYNVDLTMVDQMGMTAHAYAYYDAKMLHELLELQPQLAQLRHPTGRLMSNLVKKDFEQLPGDEQATLALYAQFEAAARCNNPDFFASIFGAIFEFDETMRELALAKRKLVTQNGKDFLKNELSLSVLTAADLLSAMVHPHIQAIINIIRHGQLDCSAFGILTLADDLARANAVYAKYIQHNDPNYKRAKAEKDLFTKIHNKVTRFIVFLQHYRAMHHAIQNVFPSWCEGLVDKLMSHMNNAVTATLTDKLKALLYGFTKIYNTNDVNKPRLQENFISLLSEAICASNETIAKDKLQQLGFTLALLRDGLRQLHLTTRYQEILQIVSGLSMAKRAEMISKWRISLGAAPLSVISDVTSTSSHESIELNRTASAMIASDELTGTASDDDDASEINGAASDDAFEINGAASEEESLDQAWNLRRSTDMSLCGDSETGSIAGDHYTDANSDGVYTPVKFPPSQRRHSIAAESCQWNPTPHKDDSLTTMMQSRHAIVTKGFLLFGQRTQPLTTRQSVALDGAIKIPGFGS